MAKDARRYEFYLPLTFNDGHPIPEQQFQQVENRLIDRFRGVTSQQRDFPLRGLWFGGERLYLDQVIIMTVVDFRPHGSTKFIGQLKAKLLREFEQLALLITESPLRVH